MDTVAAVPKSKTTNGKIKWRSGPAMKQSFPFPDTLIYYISMYPISPKAYNKIIQCCKYFFEANPILVVAQMCKYNNPEIFKTTKICYNEEHTYFSLIDECCVEIDLSELTCKIWLILRLTICGNHIPEFFSFFYQKFYFCEIVELCLYHVTIPLNIFKLLVTHVQKLNSSDVKICYNDGTSVKLDKILEVCPKIEDFYYYFVLYTEFSMLTTSTLKDISSLPNLSNLKYFQLIFVPEIFDIQNVSDFLIKSFFDTNIKLHFNRGVSAEYKSKLDAIQEKLIKLQIHNHSIIYHT